MKGQGLLREENVPPSHHPGRIHPFLPSLEPLPLWVAPWNRRPQDADETSSAELGLMMTVWVAQGLWVPWKGDWGERGSSQTVPRGASPPSGHNWELQCSQPKKCQHSVGLSTHILHPIPPHPYPADAGPPFQSLACVKDTGHLDLRLYNLPGSWVELTGVLDFLCLCQTEPLPAQACSVRAAASRRTPLGIRTLITKLSFSTLPLHKFLLRPGERP